MEREEALQDKMPDRVKKSSDNEDELGLPCASLQTRDIRENKETKGPGFVLKKQMEMKTQPSNRQLSEGHTEETLAANDHGFVLASLMSVDVLASPVRSSSRLNYTCFGVCNDYVGMGTNTGCVYLFDRGLLKHIHMISAKEGSVTTIEFSTNGNLLGLGTSQGYVVAFKLDMKIKPDIVKLAHSWEHKGSTVTAMKWDSAVDILYSADNIGRVSLLNAPSSKLKTLFKKSSETILKGDSRVVQVDFADDKLVVSTLTQCYLCDTTRHTFTTVGQKPRNGEYGACFLQTKNLSTLLYCARPGSRIWEVNSTDGTVLKTHNFKELLSIKPSPIFGISLNTSFTRLTEIRSQSLVFGSLQKLGEKYLITWTESGIYIFDPQEVDVILWTNYLNNIKSLEVYGTDVYCLCEADVIVKLTFLPFFKCASKLYHLNLYQQSAEVCYSFANSIISGKAWRYFPEKMLLSLMEHLSDDKRSRFLYKCLENLCQALRDQSSRNSGGSQPGVIRLDSGIFVVNNQWNQLDKENSNAEEKLFSSFSSTDGQIEPDNSFESNLKGEADDNKLVDPATLTKISTMPPDMENISGIVTTTEFEDGLTGCFESSSVFESSPMSSPEKDNTAGSKKTSPTSDVEHDLDLSINQDSANAVISSATNRFREQLQDSILFYNSKTLVLQAKEWFECVNHHLLSLSKNCKSNILDFSHQPIQDNSILHNSNLSSTLEQELKDMTTIVYEIEACSLLFPPVELIIDSFSWLDILKKKYYLDFGDKEKCETLEKNCVKFYTEKNILDGKQASFANTFYFILDWNRILTSMCSKPFQRIQTFLTYLSPFINNIGEEEAQGLAKSYLSVLNTNPTKFIYEAYRKFCSDFKLGLEYCVYSFPCIHPWHVIAFCYLFKKQEYFVCYIEKILTNLKDGQRAKVIKLLTEDREVCINWIYFLLSKNKNQNFDHLCCQCGIAKPGAHIYKWNYQEQLNIILNTADKMKPEDQYLIAKICWKFCYWKGYLQIIKTLGLMDEYLAYCVILGDMDLLQETSVQCFNDINECKLLLDKMKKVFSDKKLCYCGLPATDEISYGCYTSISWDNIFRLIMKSFGPEKSLQILEMNNLSPTILSSNFYLHYQMILKICEKQRQLIHGILEEVNTHLWANKELIHIPALSDELKHELQFSSNEQ